MPGREFVDLGKIASIEKDHKEVEEAKRGDSVAMKVRGQGRRGEREEEWIWKAEGVCCEDHSAREVREGRTQCWLM